MVGSKGEALLGQEATYHMGVFQVDLRKQYISKATKDQKAIEFYNLVQGNMTAAHYETKFVELSRYALHMVADDEKKAKKFQRGLAQYIYKKISLSPN